MEPIAKEKRKNDDLTAVPMAELTTDDRGWAALCWLQIVGLWPWVSLLLLIAPQTKDRPFVRYNAILSLVTAVALVPVTCVTLGLGALAYLLFFLWAYQAYRGEWVNVPVISAWVQ